MPAQPFTEQQLTAQMNITLICDLPIADRQDHKRAQHFVGNRDEHSLPVVDCQIVNPLYASRTPSREIRLAKRSNGSFPASPSAPVFSTASCSATA